MKHPKVYVIDTNVVLFDPEAIFKFEDNEVVIPITVIEEVDHFKKDANEVGRNARQFSRELDRLRLEQGQLTRGVNLPDGGLLRVEMGKEAEKGLPWKHFSSANADIHILSIAAAIQRQSEKRPVILLTKDTNLRIRADVLGVRTQDYDPHLVRLDGLYAGWRELRWSADQINHLVAEREVPAADLEHYPNELFLIRSHENDNHSVLARVLGPDSKIKVLSDFRRPVWGIQPRNLEQTFALDLLLDDSVRLVSLVGKAGTGKTLIAVAAALYKVTEEQVYQRVLVSRPVFPMGRDIGFLPGDMDEKLRPWMQPIFDNVELLMNLSHQRERRRSATGPKVRYEELIDLGVLAIEPLTYIRGRSIPDQFMIVDEAQNLTPHEIKTIITRAGDNTKVVLTGDPYQIDNPYIDSSNNGLTYVAEKMKGEDISGHVTLVKGERSRLAELASNLL